MSADQQGTANHRACHRTNLQYPEESKAFVLGSVKKLNLKNGNPEGRVGVEMYFSLQLGELLKCKVLLDEVRLLKEELTRLQTRGIITLIETSTESAAKK